jgi:hypothetical protein
MDCKGSRDHWCQGVLQQTVSGLAGCTVPLDAPPLGEQFACSPPGSHDSIEKVPMEEWMGSAVQTPLARTVPVPGQPPDGSSTLISAPLQSPKGAPHVQGEHDRSSSTSRYTTQATLP